MGDAPSASDAVFSDFGFFNRELETEQLYSTLNKPPQKLIVLTGPPNCGKSALLNHLDSLEGSALLPMLMLDCRVDKVTTPPDMVRVLRQRALDTTDKWVAGGRLVAAAAHNAASFAVPPGNYFKVNTVLQHLATDSNELFGTTTVGEAPSLTDIIRSYTKLLTRLPKEGPVPVIVIDEANRLMKWREDDEGGTQLEELLCFFVFITKQAKRAHLVLATSDFFLVEWLRGKGLSAEQMVVEVLGDLPEEEAKRYVCGDEGEDARWEGLVADFSPDLAADVRERWPEIYAVCGGNIGQLAYCLDEVCTKGVDNGVLTVEELSTSAVEQGLVPSSFAPRASPPAWTPEQWKTVLRLIATAPHHAMQRRTLADALGRSGDAILKSLVEYNLLAVRTRSTLARDLPREVYFEDGRAGSVVTMPSPGRLNDILQMLDQGKLEPSAPQSVLTRIWNLFGQQ